MESGASPPALGFGPGIEAGCGTGSPPGAIERLRADPSPVQSRCRDPCPGIYCCSTGRAGISGDAMTATDALVQLFELLFGHADLQRFIQSRVGAAGIDGARAAVQALELQGAVDAALFDRLGADFPARVPEIEQVARRWLPDRSVAATRAQPAQTAAPESGVWDIFLAHAAPDAPAAEALHDALVDTGLAVFLDSRCIGLGQRWDAVIPAALDASRLIVVLVSGRTRDAWYAREEIALAIDAGRGRGDPDRLRPLVIPVYLERLPGAPGDWIYGLRGLQGMVAADIGWPPPTRHWPWRCRCSSPARPAAARPTVPTPWPAPWRQIRRSKGNNPRSWSATCAATAGPRTCSTATMH